MENVEGCTARTYVVVVVPVNVGRDVQFLQLESIPDKCELSALVFDGAQVSERHLRVDMLQVASPVNVFWLLVHIREQLFALERWLYVLHSRINRRRLFGGRLLWSAWSDSCLHS